MYHSSQITGKLTVSHVEHDVRQPFFLAQVDEHSGAEWLGGPKVLEFFFVDLLDGS